jgi:hypothetical protein
MARRSGDRFDRGIALQPLDRPLKGVSSRSTRPGERGGTVYPTVLEAYNRDSDFRRWRSGMELYQGSGATWADLRRTLLVRGLRDHGALPGPQANQVTLFPSDTSPEGAWAVVNRRRGSIVLPQPLQSADLTWRMAERRLELDVSASLSAAQIKAWADFIGDQFEDSAAPAGACGARVLGEETEAVAYTLIGVDPAGGKLIFDLERPFVRLRARPDQLRVRWSRARFDATAPLRWRDDGSRLLCSSHRFFCSCPDYSGTRTANLLGGSTAGQELFPRVSAGRVESGRWEEEVTGYRARWRDLSGRADQRRECKHIHAVRWSLGTPFHEPSGYPLDEPDRQFLASGTRLGGAKVERYQVLRGLALDWLVIPLANSSGVAIDTRNLVPADEETPTPPERGPILWTASVEPPPGRARAGDWWLQRGTRSLRISDPDRGGFVDTLLVGTERRPFIQEWPDEALVPLEVTCAIGSTAGEAPPAAMEGTGGVLAEAARGAALAPNATAVGEGSVAALPAFGGEAIPGVAPGSQLEGQGATSAPAATGAATAPPAEVLGTGTVAAPSAFGGTKSPGTAPSAALEGTGAISVFAATGQGLAPGVSVGVYVEPGYSQDGYVEDGEPPATGDVQVLTGRGKATAPGATATGQGAAAAPAATGQGAAPSVSAIGNGAESASPATGAAQAPGAAVAGTGSVFAQPAAGGARIPGNAPGASLAGVGSISAPVARGRATSASAALPGEGAASAPAARGAATAPGGVADGTGEVSTAPAASVSLYAEAEYWEAGYAEREN